MDLYTSDDYDTVVHLNQFRAAHPDWTISHDTGLWRAHRTIGNDGSEEHVRYRLQDLLAKLESLPDV
jgi:hypothetical protein